MLSLHLYCERDNGVKKSAPIAIRYLRTSQPVARTTTFPIYDFTDERRSVAQRSLMLVNVFTLKLFMTRVIMIVFPVLTIVGMSFVCSPVFVLVRVSMVVFVSVLVRVPGIAMPVVMRVVVSMHVFMIVTMFLFFVHVDLPTQNGSIRMMIIIYSSRSTGACRQVPE